MAEGDIRDTHSRRAVSLMDRTELEDKHLRLMEESLLLKKHARNQEDKMKKMATKLIRLTSDEKKEAKRGGQSLSAVQLRQRDLEVEEMVDELQARGRELEKQNSALRNKVVVLKQQLETRGKRHTPYGSVQPRISTGLSRKSQQRSLSTEDVSIKRRSSSGSTQSVGPQPRYGHSLLEEARRDNQELEELVLHLKQEVALLTAEAERKEQQLRLRELHHEEERLSLQEQLQAQLTAVQKNSIHDDVELIKLQRELREKSTRLQSLQAQYNLLEKTLETTKASHSKVLQEMEALNSQLKEERSRASRLQSELQMGVVSQRALSELQEMVADLRAEKELLKEANERLTKSALEVDQERHQDHLSQQRVLQDRVRQLEAEARASLTEKTRLVDKLSSEREVSQHLDEELRELRASQQRLREEHQQLQDKMKFFSKESSVDWGEVEEALVLVRAGKGAGKEDEPLSFLQKVDDEDKASHRELQELRSAHADTISELDKTRRLLSLQHTINGSYKKEVESLKSQAEELRSQDQARLQEYAQLLDIKAARIRKLEGQLRDIAYGTRPYKIDTSKFEYAGPQPELEESVELERGQNLLQLHVTQVLLSSSALSALSTSRPALFLTLGFWDFEAQVTPVLQGARPLFNFTSNFVVTADDTFMHHLQKGSISVELHQALGMKHQALAVGCIRCRELLSSAGEKVHGKVVLTGVEGLQQCVSAGSLEYWMRLKLPMTQAARLYQERSQALSLIDPADGPTSTTTGTLESGSSLPPPLPPPLLGSRGPDYNELEVIVVGCSGLRTRDSAHPPSPYVMYKLYTFPDHDTPIVPHSAQPSFNDAKLFPVSMNQHLHHYLTNQSLEVYVFDNLDPVETSYLGVAQVPLLTLSEGAAISGRFQLTEPSGSDAGTIELALKWTLPYITHSASPSSPASHPHPHKEEKMPQAINSQESVQKSVHLLEKDHPETQEVKSLSDTSETPHQTNKQKQEREKYIPPPPSGQFKSRDATQSKTASPTVTQTEGVAPVKVKMQVPPPGDRSDSESSSSVAARVERRGPKVAEGRPPGIKGGQLKLPEGRTLPSLRKHPVPPLSTSTATERLPSDMCDTDSELSEVSTPLDLPMDTSDTDLKFANLEPQLRKSANNPVGVGNQTLLHVSSGGQGAGENLEGVTPIASEQEDYTDSVSVTVTEYSDEGVGVGERGSEGVEEEIEESLSEEEDTMFEETLPQMQGTAASDLDNLSSLSPSPPPSPLLTPTPVRPSVILVEGESSESPELTPSEAEDSNPVTLIPAPTSQPGAEATPRTTDADTTMSIMIVGLSLEPNGPLARDPAISKLFVEYQFLNIGYGELETPESLSKPRPGEIAVFNFKKIFSLDAEQRALLAAMLKPGDPSEGRVTFTIVSDPDDQNRDCAEISTAEVDLHMILQRGEDLIEEKIDMVTLDNDPEVAGYLIVSVEALSILQQLVGSSR